VVGDPSGTGRGERRSRDLGRDPGLFFIANDDGVRTEAFDPATERWTTYPDGPRGPTETSSWTLVGSFVVVFGGGGGLAASAKGWTFSTRDGSWGKLPTAVYAMSVPMTTAATPFDVISIGTGDFRLGADMLQAQSLGLTRPVGWNALPPTGLDPVAAGIATVAGRTIVWQTTTGRSIEWLPDEDRWGAIAFPDVVPTDCGADGAAIEGYAFTWNCGQPLVWSGATSTWSIVDRPFPEIDQGGLAIGFAVGAGQGFAISEAEPQQIGDFGRITTAPFLWFWKPPAS